jgi:hypothetical protein
MQHGMRSLLDTQFEAINRAAAPSIFFVGAASIGQGISPPQNVVPIGRASPTRVVFVGVMTRATSGSTTHSNVAVNGLSATKIAESTGQTSLSLWRVPVPEGSAGLIGFEVSNACPDKHVVAFAAYDLKVPDAVHDSAVVTGDPSSTTACAIPADGIVVGVSARGGDEFGFAKENGWTGLSLQYYADGSNLSVSAVCDAFSLALAAPTISLNFSTSGNSPKIIVASFR